MQTTDIQKAQGHWILAKMGKKVLRPGGKELTQKLIDGLNINSNSEVVEFAPGLGYTASLVAEKKPKSYTGVELDENAAHLLQKKLNAANQKIVIGNAADSGLIEKSADIVYGEAMLTMQADHRKSEIIKEAYRVLKPGGLYGIHELSLANSTDENSKAEIQRELALSIKVNARPLTENEWTALLENEGFTVKKVESNSMSLLEPKRMIDDEGLLRTIKIGMNILTHPDARKRILNMRRIFHKYHSQLGAIAIVAEKKL